MSASIQLSRNELLLFGFWDVWMKVKITGSNFQASFSDEWFRYLLQNWPWMNVNGSYWWQVNIGWC